MYMERKGITTVARFINYILPILLLPGKMSGREPGHCTIMKTRYDTKKMN